MSVGYGRFITALGATVLGAGADYAQIYEQSTLLGISGNDQTDIVNAKTIMCWGGNPAEAYIHDWQFVCEAREAGAKLITIDPQYTASAMHSDIYVPIRPGTDGALMLAMANYIIENGLTDEDFMKSRTISPFLVKEDGTYVRMSDFGVEPTQGPISSTTGKPTTIDPNVVWDAQAGEARQASEVENPELLGFFEVNGQQVQTVYQKVKDLITEYTVDKASEICDIPAEQIEELARIYATEGPVAVLTFQGLGHHVNSHHNFKNLAFIAALTETRQARCHDDARNLRHVPLQLESLLHGHARREPDGHVSAADHGDGQVGCARSEHSRAVVLQRQRAFLRVGPRRAHRSREKS